jgi:Actinobacteria/chloroflexi VLRF1 release factor
MSVRPAAGGGRCVDVDPARLPGWLNGFAGRHGAYHVTDVSDGMLHILAADGSTVTLAPPPGAQRTSDVEAFVQEALRERRIGLLLARQASAAIGVADGPRLATSKVQTAYVQSRTAAGGWSQQRYARRRENQAKAAAESAADLAVRLLLPVAAELSTVVTGGDRRTVDAILADRRLAAITALRSDRFLDVREPRLAVLEKAIASARAVRLLVEDPDPEPGLYGGNA